MIQTLFVDLFGVVLGKDITAAMNYVTGISDIEEDILQDILFGEKYMELERYEISLNQYLHYVQLKIDNKLLDIKKLTQYIQSFDLIELPMTKILQKYKSAAKLYILTNTTQRHVNQLKSKFNCLNQYEDIITSDLAMAHKPDIKIFQYACEYANTNPAASAFIDDTRRHVDVAKNLGFHAHHYRDIINLNIFLTQLLP